MAATDRSRSEAAKQRRQDQLRRWQGSETDLTGAEMRTRALKSAKVRFAQGAVFMAACSAGDRDEVAELLRQGADINYANVDGLTALHQVSRATLYTLTHTHFLLPDTKLLVFVGCVSLRDSAPPGAPSLDTMCLTHCVSVSGGGGESEEPPNTC